MLNQTFMTGLITTNINQRAYGEEMIQQRPPNGTYEKNSATHQIFTFLFLGNMVEHHGKLSRYKYNNLNLSPIFSPFHNNKAYFDDDMTLSPTPPLFSFFN